MYDFMVERGWEEGQKGERKKGWMREKWEERKAGRKEGERRGVRREEG